MRFFPRKKSKPVDGVILEETINKKLEDYYSKQEIQEYLERIKSDEKRKAIWEGMSELKKVKLLRYIVRKGEKHGT